jgi:hypothetical protein
MFNNIKHRCDCLLYDAFWKLSFYFFFVSAAKRTFVCANFTMSDLTLIKDFNSTSGSKEPFVQFEDIFTSNNAYV